MPFKQARARPSFSQPSFSQTSSFMDRIEAVPYRSKLFENSDAYYSYQTCGESNECLP